MKVSDYIVEFLISKGITDVFGYPGGMVTQLIDSFGCYSDKISAHVTYHEQAAAFAACGYAQTSGKPGVAYATSGPGATNLITGIANAFFDSIPTIFITGQVNTNEAKGNFRVRQRGFQETDIVSSVKPVTKYAVYVEKAEDLPAELDKAYEIAMSERRGPVLLDIPMNVLRTDIDGLVLGVRMEQPDQYSDNFSEVDDVATEIRQALKASLSPVILLGAGVKSVGAEDEIRTEISRLGIPVVSSMIAFDVMRGDRRFYGFLGAYGQRTANFIAAKSDLIISIGARLDIRQVGFSRESFAPDAKILRFDVDAGELEYQVHQDEKQICTEIETVVRALKQVEAKDCNYWISVCDEIRKQLKDVDDNHIGRMMENLSEQIPDGAVITTDVGQNQVWVAQSFKMKPHQKVLFSGGHGAMGYSLPAAIGAYYGSGKKHVYCITGDGGLQMNIQELQFVARERIPVKIIVINNNALGMIRHFQEMYFDSRYFQTKPEGGFSSPNFSRIAEAYGIKSYQFEAEEIGTIEISEDPELFEVMIHENTYVVPKLKFGKPNQDQEPLINRKLYERIMNMKPSENMFGGGYSLNNSIKWLCAAPFVHQDERGWAA